MKKSIRVRLAVTFIGIMLVTFLSIFLANHVLLEKYIVVKKQDSIEGTYEKLNSSDMEELIEDEEFRNLCVGKNLAWIVVDPVSSTILGSDSRNAKKLYGRLLFGYIEGIDKSDGKVLEEKENYVQEITRDNFQEAEYLDMWGHLDNGNLFLIRTPIASIRDSVAQSNMFYIYVFIVLVVLNGFLIWTMSTRITKPILELTELSKKMSDLDFDARYESGGEDEIGVLGENFNKMSGELERTISELKTANVQLVKDIEKKEQIDEMRREFLANVSHELKTPIALIQGYAEGLKECINDDAESREFYCDVIVDEAAKMNHMVRKLLTLNQLESGTDQVTMERFDLMNLVQGVVAAASILAEQKDVKIQIQKTEPVYVWGDEFKVEEVVTNYISNAINHADGEKKIDIKCVRNGEKVHLSVFNTGQPIPEEELDKIWMKFYKVDKAHTREYGGNGIGLSIVKAIMDSMKQTYGVKDYDNGVEFWFELEAK